MLAITSDNASNMDTMMDKISYFLSNHGIIFDSQNQHVRCLAHIIDLAAKKLIQGLNATGLDIDEDVQEQIEDTTENLNNTIYKVSF